jgi:hypothetical protein
MRQGKPQRYGTQYMAAGPDGPLELWPVDPSTTDEERARWGVPSFADALAAADGRVAELVSFRVRGEPGSAAGEDG